MDVRLKRALDSIARDNTHGARELTLRAARGVLHWLGRRQNISPEEMEIVGREVFCCQRSMAPMLRLANEIALSLDAKDAASAAARRVHRLIAQLTRAGSQIAAHFRRQLQHGEPREIITYSCGSTVLECLLSARRKIAVVTCSESRPANEGRLLAAKLAAAGVRVNFMIDAALSGQFNRKQRQILLLGADAVIPGYLAAKVGCAALLNCARECNAEIVVAVDSTKFWPIGSRSILRWQAKTGPADEVWSKPLRPVTVSNPYFELVPIKAGMKVLTEAGWMNREAVYRAFRRIRISPRLKQIVD